MWKARDRTAVVVPWSCVALAARPRSLAATTDLQVGSILAALVLTMGEVLVLTAVALFFSAFSTPVPDRAVHLRRVDRGAQRRHDGEHEVACDSRSSPRTLLKQLGKVWPNFNLFVPGRHTLEIQLAEGAGPLSYVANNMIYAGAYSFVVLVLAALIFQRRNFL